MLIFRPLHSILIFPCVDLKLFKDSFGWSLSLTLLKILKMEFCRISIFLCADSNSFMPLQACCRFDYFSWSIFSFLWVTLYWTFSNSSIFLKIYLVLVRPCSSLLLMWIFVQSWKHPFARGLRLLSRTLISVEPLSKFFFQRVYKVKARIFSCQYQKRPGYSTSQGLWSLLNSGSTFTFFLQNFCQSLRAQSF